MQSPYEHRRAFQKNQRRMYDFKDQSGDAGPAIALLDSRAVASGSSVVPRRPLWHLRHTVDRRVALKWNRRNRYD